MKLWKNIDPWSGIVIVLTALLFGLSLAVNGFTHDLFLESGVFLVSVKLILMTGRHSASEQRIELHLNQIKEMLASQNVTSSMEERTPQAGQAAVFTDSVKEWKKP
jgi:hypothetical protein